MANVKSRDAKNGLLIRPPWAMSSSHSANRQELDSFLPDDINAELALWKQLAFDMSSPPEKHPDQSLSNDGSTTSSSSQPHTVLPPLPPETYNYLIHALLSLQGSASHAYPPNYSPTYPYPIHPCPLPNYHRPWPSSTTPPISAASIVGPALFYPANPPIPIPPLSVPPSAGPSPLSPSTVASPMTTPTTEDLEGMEDAASTAEDKRRRNTAASARFRIKKKLRTSNLERTVADLTGRTAELERVATDLRRENAWLKEIVLLKGRNIATLNPGRQALASGNRHDQDEGDDRVHAEFAPESTVKHKEKGKRKE